MLHPGGATPFHQPHVGQLTSRAVTDGEERNSDALAPSLQTARKSMSVAIGSWHSSQSCNSQGWRFAQPPFRPEYDRNAGPLAAECHVPQSTARCLEQAL